VQADYSVELGPGDHVLEVPWTSSDGSLRYYDLRLHPELIEKIPEATANPSLKEFLVGVNRDSIFQSAKCDVWFSKEADPEEVIYGSCKFGCYVDLFVPEQATDSDMRLSFEAHERMLKRLTGHLNSEQEIPASAEFVLRRCYFHQQAVEHEALYITLYVFGYGDDEAESRLNWRQAMEIVRHVLLPSSLNIHC
jgi:hypothetical protein